MGSCRCRAYRTDPTLEKPEVPASGTPIVNYVYSLVPTLVLPYFFCSGACIRWYGAHTNRQKHTGIDHGRYRFKKVTKITEKRAQISKSNVRTSVTVSERQRLVPNPLGNVETKSWTCRKKVAVWKFNFLIQILPELKKTKRHKNVVKNLNLNSNFGPAQA